MSVKVMGKVWDADLPPNHKLVLLAIADAAEHDGTRSYPGDDRLVRMTGYSRSQVRRIIRELIEAGYLTQLCRGWRGQRAEYLVNLAKLEASQIATHSESEGSQPRDAFQDGKGRKSSRKGRVGATPSVLTRPDVSTPSSSSPRENARGADRSRRGGGGIKSVDPEIAATIVRWCAIRRIPTHTRTVQAWAPIVQAFIDAGGRPTDAFLRKAANLGIRMPGGWFLVPGAVDAQPIAAPAECSMCDSRGIVAYTPAGDLVPVDHPDAGDETDLCPDCRPVTSPPVDPGRSSRGKGGEPAAVLLGRRSASGGDTPSGGDD